ncbi:MAG: FliA/WhiG family RNA polymerase sigma factor [Candidatus Latescibacterota bacterium]
MEDRRAEGDRRFRDIPVEEDRRKGDRRITETARVQSETRGLNVYRDVSVNRSREELTRQHLKLVSYIASRLAIGLPSWVDRRDLINAGVIGLVDAVNNFDPSKGVKFESYASTRIRGAMLDELRSLDWIPRSTRAKSREIESAIGLLVGRLGRFPTEAEIAAELGWDMDHYYTAVEQVSGTTLLSLDETIETSSGGEPVKRIDTIFEEDTSALDAMERRELLDNVVKILKGLTEQERLAISLYYYEEMTLKEIGLVMGVSESRVSQVHTTAILKLRTKLRMLYSGA